jgi:hypothetical protein
MESVDEFATARAAYKQKLILDKVRLRVNYSKIVLFEIRNQK